MEDENKGVGKGMIEIRDGKRWRSKRRQISKLDL